MYNPGYQNRVAWCVSRDQGWLGILKEIDTGELHIICSECDLRYSSPEDAANNRNGDLYSGGQTIDPDAQETKNAGIIKD